MTTPEDRLALLKKRDDLPEEVKRQLCAVPPREWMRIQIVEVLREYGVLNVDELIIGLWVKFKRISTRKTVLTRITEMCDNGEIQRVKRGFYKLPEETA